MKKYLFVALSLIVFGCNSSIVEDPAIAIKFSVPELSHVKLSIENSYDTQIAVLLDILLQPGDHTVSFNANDLAEGIYYYTIKMTNQSGQITESTKRFLLIKYM